MGRWAERAAASVKYRAFTDSADRADSPGPPPPDPSGANDTIGTASRLNHPFAVELARLAAMVCPAAVTVERWDRFSRDAAAFTDRWGGTAVTLGWDALALFGCSPGFARRLDRDGLLWLIEGRPVVDLRADAAVMATPSGGRLSYYRHYRAGAALPWNASELVDSCPHSMLPNWR